MSHDKHLRCSFCGKSKDSVRKFISGPSVYICNECIALCNEILAEDEEREVAEAITQVPTPLEIKAILLLSFTIALILGSALYLMRARGYFEPKQQLYLVADNAEGVIAGMDLSFSGFPIGTVQSVSLGEEGNVRIEIDVARKDAKWLRTSSVFTLIKPLFGGAQLRAYSGVLTDPPLPDGAERPVLRGDFNEEVGRVIGAAKDVLDNLNQITAQNSELNQAMANLQVFTSKLQSRQGALHASRRLRRSALLLGLRDACLRVLVDPDDDLLAYASGQSSRGAERRRIAYTGPLSIEGEVPMTIDFASGFYFHREGQGMDMAPALPGPGPYGGRRRRGAAGS